jgi:hypothetical protein
MSNLMKKKHQLRLTELEESVLIAQVNNLFLTSFNIPLQNGNDHLNR